MSRGGGEGGCVSQTLQLALKGAVAGAGVKVKASVTAAGGSFPLPPCPSPLPGQPPPPKAVPALSPGRPGSCSHIWPPPTPPAGGPPPASHGGLPTPPTPSPACAGVGGVSCFSPLSLLPGASPRSIAKGCGCPSPRTTWNRERCWGKTKLGAACGNPSQVTDPEGPA